MPAFSGAAQAFPCPARVGLRRSRAARWAQPGCWHLPPAGTAGVPWGSLAPLHPFQAKIWAGASLPRERISSLGVSGRAFPAFRAHLSPLAPLPPSVPPPPPSPLQLGREQSQRGCSRVGVLGSAMWGAALCPSLGRSDITSGRFPRGTVCARCPGQESGEAPSKGAATPRGQRAAPSGPLKTRTAVMKRDGG